MKKNVKILILDDSADLLEALRFFLVRESFDVCTITSPEFVATEITEFRPDLIIIDVYFKGKGYGRDICRLIKSNLHTTNTPVILMSANYKALENYAECQADAVIEKPFNLSALIQKIKTLLPAKIAKDIA